MRALFTPLAFAAVVLAVVVSAAGCQNAEYAHFRRSRGVAACPNGAVIGFDAEDGVYTWSAGTSFGDLAHNITPAQFCAGAKLG